VLFGTVTLVICGLPKILSLLLPFSAVTRFNSVGVLARHVGLFVLARTQVPL
jgi:hypothetical protein